MAMHDVLAQIDAEIDRLTQAKALLTGSATAPAVKGKRGRPKGSATKAAVKVPAKKTMSPEARKRIAEAQKARWAKQKKGG